MTARRIANWIAACSFVALGAARASATAPDAFCEGCCEHDMQMFAPVDFDFDCMPMRDECGWFFNYSRLAWQMTGERAIIGVPGLVVNSEQIFPQNQFDLGTAAVPYPVINGIQDSPPSADWGWGHRYEFGYFSGGNGWMCEVLDGPDVANTEVYGFQEIEIPNTLPLITQATPPFASSGPVLNFNPQLPPLLVGQGAGSANLQTARNGFGSVHVNFETPVDFLKGWRDYHINGDPIQTNSPSTGGPGRILVVTGAAATIVNGIVTQIIITQAGVVTGGDGQVDNINGLGANNAATFYFVFQDTDGNGQFDDGEPVLGTGVDHGDLHTFNVRFITLKVRSATSTDGIELMKTVELDNSYLPVKEQRNRFDIAFGARFLRINDEFGWDGDMDTMGRTYQNTSAENQIVGPQIRARWTHQRHRLSFDLDGRFLFGYNVQDLRQRGQLFEDALPGGVNRFINAQPTAVAYGRQENNFSPVAEMRVEARYQVTGALAAKLGYTGIFVDNISRSSELVRYRLPDLGLLEGGQQNIFINGVDFGFEAVY